MMTALCIGSAIDPSRMICKVTTALFGCRHGSQTAIPLAGGNARTLTARAKPGKLLVEFKPCKNVVDYHLPFSSPAQKN
jgi:hypothetical protein